MAQQSSSERLAKGLAYWDLYNARISEEAAKGDSNTLDTTRLTYGQSTSVHFGLSAIIKYKIGNQGLLSMRSALCFLLTASNRYNIFLQNLI
jgi:hypothetical protein